MTASSLQSAIAAFVAAVKDDPNLSDSFREAANELSSSLNPPKASKASGKSEPASGG